MGFQSASTTRRRGRVRELPMFRGDGDGSHSWNWCGGYLGWDNVMK